ncbi:MAG TPA: anhydro-N-acetylmuramic acid kinase [Bacteroidetes bacterium]|nr:anhydro-N-acetylmuramic acid kinase [Bacteroidota bacterium]
MSKLSTLQKKRSKLVVGMISGTSADGIDAALVRIDGSGTSTRIVQIAFDSYQYPPELRALILDNSLPGTGSVDLLCELNVLVAHFFADAVKKIARKGRVALADIDFIGSHGQTVHHLPIPKKWFGKVIRSDLQIGDPSTIAKLTGILTVGDFRMGDMAVGGQGAPLVPYFDYVMLRSKTKNRIVLNLGGIANFTALPKRSVSTNVVAFDTGPSNMVIDALMMKFYGRKYDAGGEVAQRGKVIPELLADLMTTPYFAMRPPKSTGRELFGAMVLPRILAYEGKASTEDLVATVTRWTPVSVFDQYKRFIAKRMKAEEVIVSGGGAHNEAVMDALKEYFKPAPVKRIESLGFSADAKEAICFAILANETISERPSNVPSVTGAKRPVVLGKICL